MQKQYSALKVENFANTMKTRTEMMARDAKWCKKYKNRWTQKLKFLGEKIQLTCRPILVWTRHWTTSCCFQLAQPERRSWTQSRLYKRQMLNWSPCAKLFDDHRWRSASSMKSLLRTVLLTYSPARPQGGSLTTFLSSLARCRWTEKTKKSI